MENLTANKVLKKTFEHLEQMVEAKKRRNQTERDEFEDVDPVSENSAYDKKRVNGPAETSGGGCVA
jgi:hypothetical protein